MDDVNPRVVLLMLVLALGVVTAAVFPGAQTRGDVGELSSVDRPNIVVVVADDLRADEIRYLPRTRRLLGDHGTTYTGAISPHPLCCPARAELVTGQYGQNNGVRHSAGLNGGASALEAPDDTIARWMKTAGYRTAFHGKYLNGYRAHMGAPAGWDIWDALIGGIYSYKRSTWYDGDEYHDRYITEVTTDRVGRMVGRLSSGSAPFFLVVNHTAPHNRFTPNGWKAPLSEPRYAREYERLRPRFVTKPSWLKANVGDLPRDIVTRHLNGDHLVRLARARARALRSVDDSIAALIKDLATAGELDDTYVVVTSDNGYSLGEHHIEGKNVLTDESLDVPLLVRGPGIRSGAVDPTPVTLVDLPATILAWAGATASREQDGLPITDREALAGRDTLLIQTGDGVHDADGGWWYRGVLTERYLYAVRPGRPGGLLFDRARDPHALRNLFADRAYRSVRDELGERLEVLLDCAGDQCNVTFGPVAEPSG